MDKKIPFSEVVYCWWSFFWRYAVILIPALILSGYLINILSGLSQDNRFLFYFSYSIGLVVKLLVILLVFKFILGRKKIRKISVLVPAKAREKYLQSESVGNPAVLMTGISFFLRFCVFAFGFGVIMMLGVFWIGQQMGYSSFELAKHAKLVGNLAAIPASFIVFLLMLKRSPKRRKLDIVRLDAGVGQ
ncbi:MAG: hypothetical protein JXR78_11465 [Victivallales bacterium]|nr:hypothetical protein [Victivallales bacterium]